MNELRRLWRVLPFISPILIAALTGIVGNRADALFLITFELMGRKIPIQLWVLALLMVIALLPSTLRAAKLYRAHKIAINLIELDDTLLRLLREFKQTYNSSGRSLFRASRPPRNEAVQRLVEDLLEKALDVFYLFENCAIEMWHPDPNSPDDLILWGQANSVDSARARTRFYIGSQDRPRSGLAGYTFIDREIRVTHISRKNGEWVADLPEYLFISGRERANRFPYRTLIAIPIIVASTDQSDRCIGVLCMYSMDSNAFDSGETQKLLVSIADRIASMCVITQNLHS
jgi:hypothetical protein